MYLLFKLETGITMRKLLKGNTITYGNINQIIHEFEDEGLIQFEKGKYNAYIIKVTKKGYTIIDALKNLRKLLED